MTTKLETLEAGLRNALGDHLQTLTVALGEITVVVKAADYLSVMRVMIAAGYYDMATPFYAAEYTVSAMNLDPTLRKNISFSKCPNMHEARLRWFLQKYNERQKIKIALKKL